MLSICKGYLSRCAHPIFLGPKAAKILHFLDAKILIINKSESIFLAPRVSENLNFIIFRTLDLNSIKAISVVSQK